MLAPELDFLQSQQILIQRAVHDNNTCFEEKWCRTYFYYMFSYTGRAWLNSGVSGTLLENISRECRELYLQLAPLNSYTINENLYVNDLCVHVKPMLWQAAMTSSVCFCVWIWFCSFISSHLTTMYLNIQSVDIFT